MPKMSVVLVMIRGTVILRDLRVKIIKKSIKKIASTHEKKVQKYPNVKLLDN